MTNIPISKERGLDPHLTICPSCGGDGDAITVGIIRKATLPNGQTVYANQGQTTKTGRDLVNKGIINSPYDLAWETITDPNERIISSQPCRKCIEHINEMEQIVKEGGVYFKCKECQQDGVIKKNKFTNRVREHTGIEAPDPCGVEFNYCVEHGG